MKIVVIGGSGLIGSKLVDKLESGVGQLDPGEQERLRNALAIKR